MVRKKSLRVCRDAPWSIRNRMARIVCNGGGCTGVQPYGEDEHYL
ncbi:hypothetical protein [Xylanibacter caecicola]|nr:hypothetical protein [Xylanibacter caecicola]